ncbi:efflux RND transporter periplasmic adaptor subunit [Lysinibacillus sp. BW-2-10]|uniref:efflux RND transporter periplasmic adaptor subunit n=1 Tax=Lysinibacillus sp. BW-2-10 TaxID=2590030 RepID=UPI00117D671C|nr:HlyD family efflux transporter periplasmic adaptor subunit [Lysinibacillus sp. BW-2-10]TSI05093.1 HlyD family efflux transporter periplasmic adaptor subunit [Lysinibacillus sp. BW-2-10]
MKRSTKITSFVVGGVLVVSLISGAFFTQKGSASYEEETVQIEDMTTYYSFSGTVDAKARQNIVSQKEMHVEEVLVKAGDQVKTGDVLVLSSEGEEIRAEIDGEVAGVYTKNNSHAMKGTRLVDIVDYSNLHVKVKVDEYDLKYVEVDQEVDVTINALEKDIKGKIYAISKEAINENGISYFTAMIDFEKDESIRVGMSAESKVLKDHATGINTVSMKAIQFDSKNKPYVLITSEDGKPIKQYVETGINDGTTIEVKSGLEVDDVVMIPKAAPVNSAAAMHGGGNQ